MDAGDRALLHNAFLDRSARRSHRCRNLLPEFYGANFAPTSWVAHQSPLGGAIVQLGTTVSMGVSDAEQP